MRFFLVVAIVAVALLGASPICAKDVNIQRVLAEHKITVVTTEAAESLSAGLPGLGLRSPKVTNLSGLLADTRKLKDEESLLFLIDRSKTTNLAPEEEKLLPYRVLDIGRDEVLLYAAKAAGRNGWDVMISAPNSKWLLWEIDRLAASGIGELAIAPQGTAVERFEIKRVHIVSNESRKTAADWVTAQNIPGRDAIDWDFFWADQWDGAVEPDAELMFILNTQSLSAKACDVLRPYLPAEAQKWLGSPGGAVDEMAVRGQVATEQGGSRYVSVAAAPGSRHVALALDRYPKLIEMPESMERTKLVDLRGFEKVIVVAKSAGEAVDPRVLDEAAGGLTGLLAPGSGFFVKNADKVDNIAALAGPGTALAVIEVSAVDEKSSYSAGVMQCLTEPLPVFKEKKPEEPREPQPNDKTITGAYKYKPVNGSRANDPIYKKDHDSWRDYDMRTYKSKLSDWESRKKRYEDGRLTREMEWVRTVNRTQTVNISGTLKLCPLGSANLDETSKAMFSCQIKGAASRRDTYREEKTKVKGEGNRPDDPELPKATDDVKDRTIVNDSVRDACEQAYAKLMRASLLPSDQELQR